VPVFAGREFARDASEAPNVVIVNQALVRRHFGHRDPVGSRLVIQMREPLACTIIGVAGDVRQYNLKDPPTPEIYAPYTQRPWMLHDTRDLIVRGTLNSAAASSSIRRLVRQMEPDIPLKAVSPMEEVIGETLVRPRFYSVAIGIFATAALLLAAFGIYGAVSGAVAERTREIGIRIALGAQKGQMVRLLARQGALPALLGLVAGLPLALVVVRLLGSYFEGIGAPDLPVLFAVTLMQAFVAIAAAVVPAQRVLRMDSAAALRHD
jgi:putative ABC transport system permease protein